MQRVMCKSKIHRAVVTQANLDYMGSITLDAILMVESDIKPYEQVHVVNVTNGNRFITYAIAGPKDSGIVCVNGAAARLVAPKDIIIILSYAHYMANEMINFKPRIVFVDRHNRLVDVNTVETEALMYDESINLH